MAAPPPGRTRGPAIAFAIGFMLAERVDLVCNLRRNDFHTDPGDPQYGAVSIRAINKKTVTRSNWMCSWLEDVFKQDTLTIGDREVRVGLRGGLKHSTRKQTSQWHGPKETEGHQTTTGR
jgi:hypothetical protein